jgi:peptide chain release factor 1
MFDKLDSILSRFEEIDSRLSSGELDSKEVVELTKERSSLEELVTSFKEFKKVTEELESSKELLAAESDPSMKELAKEEIKELSERYTELEARLKILLLPKDPNDDKNVILEIRAGTGGDEASLFAGDLYRMYERYAANKGFKIEVMSVSEGTTGGVKEVVALVSGDQVYSNMKFEAGTHRVQRVPSTESQGRIHTSAATVAILPEAEEVDIDINPNDIRIDVFRAGGHGGQSVNTTDSAVRITHLETGITVSMQDEKSQHKNKAKAMKILRSRLYEHEQSKLDEKRSSDRKSMVGSGDRSEKIRTYNFPQSRITDHRIGLTVHNLSQVLDGALDDIVEPLRATEQAEMLKAQGDDS